MAAVGKEERRTARAAQEAQAQEHGSSIEEDVQGGTQTQPQTKDPKKRRKGGFNLLQVSDEDVHCDFSVVLVT